MQEDRRDSAVVFTAWMTAAGRAVLGARISEARTHTRSTSTSVRAIPQVPYCRLARALT